jgi:hypothetical protein
MNTERALTGMAIIMVNRIEWSESNSNQFQLTDYGFTGQTCQSSFSNYCNTTLCYLQSALNLMIARSLLDGSFVEIFAFIMF